LVLILYNYQFENKIRLTDAKFSHRMVSLHFQRNGVFIY